MPIVTCLNLLAHSIIVYSTVYIACVVFIIEGATVVAST